MVFGDMRCLSHRGKDIKKAFYIAYQAGQRLDLPLVYDEFAHHGGYNYYPDDEQVWIWFVETQFTLLNVTEGDTYRHYLARKEKG
jgi:hypothetical protein